MLELRPNCQMCDRDLPPEADARICTYECTYCPDCADVRLRNVCPNCGGGLAPRPVRPAGEHRPGLGLRHHPASTRRRSMTWSPAEIDEIVARLADVPPADR